MCHCALDYCTVYDSVLCLSCVALFVCALDYQTVNDSAPACTLTLLPVSQNIELFLTSPFRTCSN